MTTAHRTNMGEIFLVLLIALFALSWVLPRRFRGRGVIAFYFCVLPIGVAAMFGNQQCSPNPTNSVGQAIEFLLVVLSICLGVALPLSFLAMRKAKPAVWNPRVSVYWLWVVIVFGTIAAIPWHPFPEKHTGSIQYLPVATAYSRPDLFDNWQGTLLCHTFVALLVAVPAAVRHTIIRRKRGLAEPANFDLRQLLTAAGILALVFGLLIRYGAPPVVFCVVILLYAGCPTTLILAGVLLRQRESSQGIAQPHDSPGTA